MRNNILGGLVIFMVVVTCLLLLDDISNPPEQLTAKESAEMLQTENQSNLAVIDNEQ